MCKLGFILSPCSTVCFRSEAVFGKYSMYSVQLKSILCMAYRVQLISVLCMVYSVQPNSTQSIVYSVKLNSILYVVMYS